ncbi:TonB-dependent receptor plug domain-containing protein [Silanimonas sp.]|jgi:outer membrane cobalamin receptor|uniref:TonB-dependent receptor plug domain-containing protein n=1 Tax=Silanimonas sp. TaxID=1929290 RepID=UPI0037CB7875
MPHRCARLLLCLGAALAAAEARSAVDASAEGALLDLSLDDLLALEVSGVGLSAEGARSSAAIVDVVTRKEWEAMGARTLVDVVALLPGTRVLQRSTFTNAFTSLHGTAINDNDNHLLILVNGLPWRTSSVGGSNRLLYDALPLAVVERVELVRGQTVTLHGSNAVAGILNIVVRSDAASEAMARVSNQGAWTARSPCTGARARKAFG